MTLCFYGLQAIRLAKEYGTLVLWHGVPVTAFDAERYCKLPDGVAWDGYGEHVAVECWDDAKLGDVRLDLIVPDALVPPRRPLVSDPEK
jgi:hypothetical protein